MRKSAASIASHREYTKRWWQEQKRERGSLTAKDVRRIRLIYAAEEKPPVSTIARRFGISYQYALDVVKGRRCRLG